MRASIKQYFISTLTIYVALLSTCFSGESATPVRATNKYIDICSFNIQFLGASKKRDNESLVKLVKNYDIVVIQELIAPPYSGTFPNGDAFKTCREAAVFFDLMKQAGFEYWLSEEDTGTGDKIHLNSSATEWWVVFYKPGSVKRAGDLPQGFLASDRSNHPDYERVPYAFAFRSVDATVDFVLISVHLQPGDGKKDKSRRKHELASINTWINGHTTKEKDFILLGDMNIEDEEELTDSTPQGFCSLNDECRQTNTNVRGPKPYDHIMFTPAFTNEIDRTYDMKVVDLIQEMKGCWKSSKKYPGNPYDHNKFRAAYSDHNPVLFRVNLKESDDD